MSSVEKNFHHPYIPYDIQSQFMQALYDCIEESKVGIFESPTGTGKSLSLICGALTWLRDHKRAAFLNTIDQAPLTLADGEPEWMLEYSRREKARSAREKRKQLEDRLAKVRAEEERQRKQFEDGNYPSKRQKLTAEKARSGQGDETQFELEDYYSDDEERATVENASRSDGIFSADTLALLEKLSGGPVGRSADSEPDDEIQVFYCSRTHSQLTQFAHELRRVKLPPSVPPEVSDHDVVADNTPHPDDTLEESMKHLSLGSRKTLCINPKVRALGNSTAINERCLEIQRPGTPAEQRCQFVLNKENETLVNDFRDHTLAKVRDIEDIGKIGSKIGICPYYASRSIIKYSEIVTLPYPLLLQRSAREALNISLKNHVVIIDEAHNLMDAISNIHSMSLSLAQVQLAIYQLTTYARKYKTRLSGRNRVYVTQVIRLVNSISDYLKTVLERKRPAEGVLQPSDLMTGKGVDQINPHKLSRYLHESKLARKVDGFIEQSSMESQAADKNASRLSVPVLFQVQSFLISLMNPSSEGKLFYEINQNDVLLKYMLLDPTNHFREIVEDARAVILAGGTMSPMDDYAEHLFPYLDADRLKTFSYGHVIPPDNLTAIPVSKGAFNTEFDFTYGKRNDESMIIDLGRTITALCRVIPDGVVVFFPSYDYLNQVLVIWKKQVPNTRSSIIDSIEKSKAVFHESQDKTTNTDELLQDYSNAINGGSRSGALLLSVMGGKLSEGINFSDKLGRGVIVVGLPFPNIRSAVWQAKIQYVEQKAYELSSSLSSSLNPDQKGQDLSEESRKIKAKTAGRVFYENACMRTVNQCIGRAIRHQGDYAVILMMDRRYGSPRIQSKLPNWIRQNLVAGSSEQPIDRTIGDISGFFRRKRALNIK
ncbi:chromosome transmission fidelity protein 1 [Blastomyces parvus]|uniref:ATP-dependent DNA helicase CHL1 n=1 Tax=Blastomyces parvus TaxID=2060905 RepID=A0A2B7WV54_9EURO|nr:chromosome transmission fidelity protein 1 [Blastomyces parvus]